MAKSVVGLNIKIGATVATLQRDLGQASNAVKGFGNSAGGAAGGVGSLRTALASTMRYLGPFIGAMAAFRGAKFAVGLAAEMEAATVSFTTMLGSAEKATKVLKELSEFSAATPFEFSELRDSARLLLANNLPAEQLIQTMKVLGDIASGTGAPLVEITRIFNKMRATGRVTLENINELMLRNIPIWDLLAKKTGKSKDELRSMATAGQISFALMNETLTSLTTTGGLFGDAMKKQSSTLNGVISTLKDNIALLATEVGIKLLPAIKAAAEAMTAATGAVRNLDSDTVRNILTMGTFVAGLTAVVVVVPRVVAGIRAIVVALRALSIAGTLAQASTGVGLVTALAGLAVAGTAAYAVGEQFDRMTESMAGGGKMSRMVAEELAKAGGAVGAVAETMDRMAEVVEDSASDWERIGQSIADSVATPAEKMKQKLEEIRGAFAGGFIDEETATRAIKAAHDELDSLSKARDSFRSTPSIGAAVGGTAGGFAAVQGGQQALKDLADATRRREVSDKKREKLLEDIRKELGEIKKKTEPPKVKEHAII